MQDHTKLVVWQRARSLTVSINEATRQVRRGHAPGLRPQLMRAAMSIAANIADGASRDSRIDFARFVTIAMASSSEAEHHLGVCCDLGLLERSIAERLMHGCAELRRMLLALRRALLAAEAERLRKPGAVKEPEADDSRLVLTDDSLLVTRLPEAGEPVVGDGCGS
jgi:four helix bundle protein